MTKKRELMFSIVRGLLAILIALLVATLLIFISANGESVSEKLSSTGDALKQMLVGPLFRVGKNGTSFETKRLTDILAAMIPIIFTGLSVCIMFSANQFNLGAEGGIMLGAFVTSMAAIYLPMSAGLHPIVVKGQLCSRLYALKDHRISADDDLFVPDDEFIACHKLLCEAGMVTATPEEDIPGEDEISYTKPGSPLYIELHRRLFDSSETAHDDLNGFFDGIHSRAVEVDGLLAMPPHDHMLYLILHAYKHFVGCGIGLRQFCDIGLWARAYHDKIDWELLGAQCERVHAAVFAAAAFRIARECLGVDFELPERWQTDIDIEPMLHDTFEGGIYGSNDRTRLHSSTVTLNAVRSSRHGEKSSILRSVFPAKSYMERRYAYLKKHPALLPVAWVQRIAHYAEEKRGDNSAAGSVRLAKKRIGLMKMYGIME